MNGSGNGWFSSNLSVDGTLYHGGSNQWTTSNNNRPSNISFSQGGFAQGYSTIYYTNYNGLNTQTVTIRAGLGNAGNIQITAISPQNMAWAGFYTYCCNRCNGCGNNQIFKKWGDDAISVSINPDQIMTIVLPKSDRNDYIFGIIELRML